LDGCDLLPLGDRKVLKDSRFSAYLGGCCVGNVLTDPSSVRNVGNDPSSGDSGVKGGIGFNTDALFSHSL
jgi:hypothetical protein